MKKLQNCEVENCIPTPTSCLYWNGGDVEFLGICNGDPLNNLLWEILTKLEDITGDDLSSFDIDSLLEVCNQKAPTEITILSILNLLKANDICLKEYIDTLAEQIAELQNVQAVNVNLKCYAEFDNLGNGLSITREQLDQLIIDNLCNHKQRIESLEGGQINLQNQIDNLDIPDMTEQEFATCVDPIVKPTSSQVVSVADAHCDLEEATGSPADVSSALAQTPADLNAEFGLIPGWILAPANWAENYNNLLLEVEALRQRIITIEENCCALSCDDLELGFTAIYNEDADGIIISFTFGAGTNIPAGFTDAGSHGTITDVDGNSVDFNITIANNATEEVIIAGLNTTAPLDIEITAIMSTGGLTCQKCLSRKVSQASCAFCEVCAVGDDEDGSIVIIYESTKSTVVIGTTSTTTTTSTSSTSTSSTTSTSTTTTTTSGV